MATHLANESELIAAAQAGNREAFGVLMNSCYAPTYRLAVGIMRNQEDAEDVLQEAMLKAYCNLSKFQGHSRFYTWIVRITINEALMKIRRRHSERQVVLDDVIESERGYLRQEIEDWSNYPEKLFAQRELGRDTHGCPDEVESTIIVSVLPSQCRGPVREGDRRKVGIVDQRREITCFTGTFEIAKKAPGSTAHRWRGHRPRFESSKRGATCSSTKNRVASSASRPRNPASTGEAKARIDAVGVFDGSSGASCTR